MAILLARLLLLLVLTSYVYFIVKGVHKNMNQGTNKKRIDDFRDHNNKFITGILCGFIFIGSVITCIFLAPLGIFMTILKRGIVK